MTRRQFFDWQTAGGGGDVTVWVASLPDTLRGKLKAFQDPDGRPSKRRKDLLDLARLVEAHPGLLDHLPPEVQARLND